MNYSEKSYEEIFEIMLEDSVNVGLMSHAEDFINLVNNREDISNYYVMDKSVIANMFRIFYEQGATPIYNSVDLDLAEGIDLDNLGKARGIERPPATHASVEVTFTLQNSDIDKDVRINEGIVVATDDGINYVTVEQLFIPVGMTSATITCMSLNTGADVKVLADTLVNIVSDIEYDLICNNEYGSSGGADEYSDDDYRELLKNWFKIHLKGSNEAYDYYFASFDGIDGYKLVPNWDVTGRMKVILDPGSSYLLNKAYNELQNNVTQGNEDIIMFPPTIKPIDIYAMVDVDIDMVNPYSDTEKEDIKNKISSAIKVFIDEGYKTNGEWCSGLSIGEDFIPHKLAVFLDNEIPELKNITFKYPEDYVAIADDELGKVNNINIEMI